MSLQQAKRLLDKINALHKSMSLDEGEVASIERDLMLSYVRQLYEAFLDINVQSPLTKPASRPEPAPPPPPAVRHEPEPEPVRPHAEVRQPPPPPPPVQQAPRPEPRPIYQPEPPAPRPEQRPSYQAEQNRPEPEPPSYRREPEPTYRPEPPRDYQPAPQPAYQPEPPRTASTTGDPRLNGLFNFQQARELSEKLGEQRIVDLTKAMTINDRLLFANDLFGGDSRAMMTTLEQLNRFSGMDQARPMLEDLARQYKWTDDERDDTARNFIKLVRRRYA